MCLFSYNYFHFIWNKLSSSKLLKTGDALIFHKSQCFPVAVLNLFVLNASKIIQNAHATPLPPNPHPSTHTHLPGVYLLFKTKSNGEFF